MIIKCNQVGAGLDNLIQQPGRDLTVVEGGLPVETNELSENELKDHFLNLGRIGQGLLQCWGDIIYRGGNGKNGLMQELSQCLESRMTPLSPYMDLPAPSLKSFLDVNWTSENRKVLAGVAHFYRGAIRELQLLSSMEESMSMDSRLHKGVGYDEQINRDLSLAALICPQLKNKRWDRLRAGTSGEDLFPHNMVWAGIYSASTAIVCTTAYLVSRNTGVAYFSGNLFLFLPLIGFMYINAPRDNFKIPLLNQRKGTNGQAQDYFIEWSKPA